VALDLHPRSFRLGRSGALMHELSIADALVQIVVRHAEGRPVARVQIMLGDLRQASPAAIEFAFELVAQGTPAEGALLDIERVAVGGRCRACGADGEHAGLPLICAACGGWEIDVLRGEELRVEWLELAEPAPDELITTSGGPNR